MAGGPHNRRIDFSDLLRPPRIVAEFVERITKGVKTVKSENRVDPGAERRQAPRFLLPVRVDVQPVDDEFQLTGEPYTVVAHDISIGGIGIRDTRAVESKYLALQVTGPAGERMQMLLEVLRCDRQGNVFDIGGRFIRYVASDDASIKDSKK